MTASAFKKEPHQLAELELPVIIFWNFDHFVVLEGFGPKGARLNDPAMGRRLVTPGEFDESFTGVVLTFSPTPEFERGGRRRSVFRALIDRLNGAGVALLFAVMVGAGLIVSGLATPAFIGIFVDQVLTQRLDTWSVPLLLTMLAAGVFAGALVFLHQIPLLPIVRSDSWRS